MKRAISHTHSWTFLLIAFFAAFVVIFFANSVFYAEYIKETKEVGNMVIPNKGIAWVELDFGNGFKRLFEGNLQGNSYPLLVALGAAADAGNFGYKIDTGKITSLAGKRGKWKIYRNGNLVTGAIDSITVQKGDQFILRLE